MTDDEKEEEARKLADLIKRLNEWGDKVVLTWSHTLCRKGIIQMMPLGSENQPIEFPPDVDNDKGDDDHNVDVDWSYKILL